jgi:hypothetical protein
LTVLGMTACQKKLDSKEIDTSGFQILPYYNAHNAQGQWTQNRIFDSLVGTWQWQYRTCEGMGYTSVMAEDGLTIQFQKDSTLIATKSGKSEKTRFKVVVEDRIDFAVFQDSKIAKLDGRIYFYDNKVIFNNSYLDGCDNYFIRVK